MVQQGSAGSDQQVSSFGIMVLVNPKFHSLHIVATPKGDDKEWDTLMVRGHIREIWILADNPIDALTKAREKGILEL
jgi:hypothetical protein